MSNIKSLLIKNKNSNVTDNTKNQKCLTSRVSSGKIPELRLEELKNTIKANNLIRQKSASDRYINKNQLSKDEISICHRIKIRENFINGISNECHPYCSNYEKIKKFEKELKDLLEANCNLKRINECLIKSIIRKEDLCLNVLSENKNLKIDNQILNSHLGSKSNFSSRASLSRNNNKTRRTNTNDVYYNLGNQNNHDYFPDNLNGNLKQINNGNRSNFNTVNIENPHLINLQNVSKGNHSNFNEVKYLIEAYNKDKEIFNNNPGTKNNNNNVNDFLLMKKLIFSINQDNSNLAERNYINNVSIKEGKNKYSPTIQNSIQINNNNDFVTNSNSNLIHIIQKEDNKMNNIEETNLMKESNNFPLNKNSLIKCHSDSNGLSTKFIEVDSISNFYNKNSDINPVPNTNKMLNSKVNIKAFQSSFSPNKHRISQTTNLKNQLSKRNSNTKNYYDKISGIIRKKRGTENSGRSHEENLIPFLSLEEVNIGPLFKNQIFKKIQKLTENNNVFLEKIQNSDEEKLLDYCDLISIINENLKYSTYLIVKLKAFVLNIINMEKSFDNQQDIFYAFSEMANKIFNCEKTLIFKHDELSDKFLVDTGDQKIPNKIFMNKDFGILSQALKSNDVIRIEDANLDPRFDKNIDQVGDIKPKNMLCGAFKITNIYEAENNRSEFNESNNDPEFIKCRTKKNLKTNYSSNNSGNSKQNSNNKEYNKINFINANYNQNNSYKKKKTINNKFSLNPSDKSDNIFNESENYVPIGVIQIINKKKGIFNSDDEELFRIFSSLVGQFYENSKKKSQTESHISKLTLYSEIIEKNKFIGSILDLITYIENMVKMLFSGNTAQLMLYDDEKGKLYRISKYENKELKKNVGIIGYVLDKKEYYGCESIINCQYYHAGIDTETTLNLLTYPIHYNLRLIAILQFGYHGKLTQKKRPKKFDEDLILNIIKTFTSWFVYFKENEKTKLI